MVQLKNLPKLVEMILSTPTNSSPNLFDTVRIVLRTRLKRFNRFFVEVGVTAWGPKDCGSDLPSVYSRLSNSVPWITKVNLISYIETFDEQHCN